MALILFDRIASGRCSFKRTHAFTRHLPVVSLGANRIAVTRFCTGRVDEAWGYGTWRRACASSVERCDVDVTGASVCSRRNS